MPDASLTDPRCERCKFWDSSTTLVDDDDASPCRIKPPTRDKRTHRAVWPFTDANDWCGAFVRDPEQQED